MLKPYSELGSGRIFPLGEISEEHCCACLIACLFIFSPSLEVWRGACLLEYSEIFTFQSSFWCRDLKYCCCLGCPGLDLCHRSQACCTLKACSLIWGVRLFAELGCAELERQKSHELNVFIFAAFDLCDCGSDDPYLSHITAPLCGLCTLSTAIDLWAEKW